MPRRRAEDQSQPQPLARVLLQRIIGLVPRPDATAVKARQLGRDILDTGPRYSRDIRDKIDIA